MQTNPHYHLVPKDVRRNQKFRRMLLEMGSSSKTDAAAIRAMCAQDILFWVNAFCYTLDPRKKRSPVIPFITYEFQDESLLDLKAAIRDGHDAAIEKSRDMGASWMMCQVCDHGFLFEDHFSALMLSRKEEYVDKKGDNKTLFAKIDFLHKWMPTWLLPPIVRTKQHFGNEANGSTIDGESTNAEAGRGDRRTCIIQDEFAAVENGHQIQAATGDTTNCRIFNSTPMGTANAFYDVVSSPEIKKIRLHWTRHPEKAKGLYYDGGKPRSPWYDRECARRVHPVEIAQEQDIDYQGSAYTYYEAALIDRLISDCKAPSQVGEIIYDPDTGDFQSWTQRSEGVVKLWRNPDAFGEWNKDRRFAIGCDISAGTGSSNSCATVFDCTDGIKVAEVVTPNMRPDQFASYIVALCKWFKGGESEGAFLIWEANGAGRLFGDKVVEQGYRNIYRREIEGRIAGRFTANIGWASTKDNKVSLLGDYREAISKGLFVNPSRQAIDELREYIYSPTLGVVHARSSTTLDPSGARDNHGDRVIADALAWRGAKKSVGFKRFNAQQFDALVARIGSLAHRRKLVEANNTQRDRSWG